MRYRQIAKNIRKEESRKDYENFYKIAYTCSVPQRYRLLFLGRIRKAGSFVGGEQNAELNK